MGLLIKTLTICLALSLSLAAPSHHADHPAGKPSKPGKSHDHSHDHHDHSHDHDHHHLDRCTDNEFDAVIENAQGIPYFFKGDHVFKGFHGDAELTNKTFPELDDHLLGHIDAAFRMPPEDSPDHHEHLYFFLDDKVFNYENHKLEAGFPKTVAEAFPGIPDHLDASVECHKPDCPSNSIIFFKDHQIFHFDINTKKVDEKEFKSMPNCTGAFRYMGHYYCLHGHQFSKFNPNTGEVDGKYPKEIRDYFMKCEHFGNKTEAETIAREQCSHVHLDAITEEDDGDLFAFRGHFYLSKIGGKFHAGTIESTFKGLHSDVDAVFSHDNHLHIVKDNQVFAYDVTHNSEDHVTPRAGYPKSLKDDLGIEGHVDAAFACPNDNLIHIIKGHNMVDVDLKVSPPVVKQERPIPFKKIDTAMCGSKGVKVIVGDHFYEYGSPMILATSKINPVEHDVSHELLGCKTDHHAHHAADHTHHKSH